MGGLLLASGCGDGSSAPVGGTSVYTATIEVTNDVGLLGSIALDLRYVGIDGEFPLDTPEGHCEILAPGAFAVITRRSNARVSVGLASFSGIATPGPLLRCQLHCGDPLDADDLAVHLREALDLSGAAPSILPLVQVTDVAAPSLTTTTLGD